MSDRATSAPFPSTPVGKQGAIPIATRVEPPAVASRVAEDFIVYPHHLIFSVEPKNESHHAWKTGMPLTARQARVGEAARSMCNFRMFGDASTATSIKNDYNIRFLGVSYEGTPDYRAAQASPDSNGRFSVSISGKATIFCDTRPLRGAKIGDVIFAHPEPAKFTWQDGSRKFNPPRLGYASPGGGHGSMHAGDAVAAELICDGQLTPFEYTYAFKNLGAKPAADQYPEIRAAIASYVGHRWTGIPEVNKQATIDALRVYLKDSIPESDINTFVDSVPDNEMKAAMALVCGRMYSFKDSSGVAYGPAHATADEKRALDNLVKQITGEEGDKLVTSMTQADLEAFMNKVLDSDNHRGYPLLGIAAALASPNIDKKLLIEILDAGSHHATAGSFHQHAATIRTAAEMGRPSKRIRTGAHFGSSGHRGYPIGTLVELGDWSGRPNECSILIDPRLGL